MFTLIEDINQCLHHDVMTSHGYIYGKCIIHAIYSKCVYVCIDPDSLNTLVGLGYSKCFQ